MGLPSGLERGFCRVFGRTPSSTPLLRWNSERVPSIVWWVSLSTQNKRKHGTSSIKRMMGAAKAGSDGVEEAPVLAGSG